eukprot:TRINITY_DN11956_c0_g6_i5.p1 TRINITY_DN11956_c0_g6~~TRINITY_DN11956_c0_g6_i5.p1  ORF type:complete len:181 (+),score=32.95 TRINITY_DN11956_c0_g6_i5:309-851(+)
MRLRFLPRLVYGRSLQPPCGIGTWPFAQRSLQPGRCLCHTAAVALTSCRPSRRAWCHRPCFLDMPLLCTDSTVDLSPSMFRQNRLGGRQGGRRDRDRDFDDRRQGGRGRGRGRGRGGRGGGRGGRKPRQDEKPVDGDKLDDALDSWRKKGGLKTVEPTALDEQLEAYKAKDAANGDEAAE